MDNLPVNPQLKTNSQSLSVFCQVISQAGSQLSDMTDSSSPQNVSLHNLMKHNLPAVKDIVGRLEADLG
jgi:hypothetical protein